ncbi:MAG TPA: rhodanese-like domain-containing protein [Nocardioides sp.]|nr:rhodanese-like domain-containing protein [Nocardioides sp.]
MRLNGVRAVLRVPNGTAFWRSLTGALALVVVVSGCAGSNSDNDPPSQATQSQATSAAPTEVVELATAWDAIADGATTIDVRTPEEFATGHLRGAINIDLSAPDFDERIAALDETASYVVYCASGNRAGTAIKTMRGQGFDDIINGGGYEDLAAFKLPKA